MPFELGRPAALALLGLLGPLLVLYLLKVRRRRVAVGSTWLWAAARRDLRSQTPWRRLVAQVPLLLQAGALIALAIGFAEPQSRGGELPGQHVVFVVDVSASMAAVGPDGRARIDEAKQQALERLAALEPGAAAQLVAAGQAPEILVPFERDRRRLASAIERLEPQDVAGDIETAMALANERLAALPGSRRLIVLTDQRLATRPAAGGPALDLVQVGAPGDNTAIVRLDVRSGTDPTTGREQVQAFAVVRNFGKRREELFVSLRQHRVDAPLASRRLTLAPGERAPVILTFESSPADAGMGIFVEVDVRDRLLLDNRAYALVPPSRKLRVVLASDTVSPWLVRALRADPEVELLQANPRSLAEALESEHALAVFSGSCPGALPPADVLVVDPPPGRCGTVDVGPAVEHPQITSWLELDPRLRFLTLEGVAIASARTLSADGQRSALVRSTAGPIIADASLPDRATTIVGFDVGESTWPLSASFVVFVRNVVELARAHRAHGLSATQKTGQPLRVRVPSTATEVKVEGPRGPVTARKHEGYALIPELTSAGFYHVSWQGPRPGSTLTAVNLLSERESNLYPTAEEAALGPTASATAPPPRHNDFTWVAALAALGLIAADVLWLTRSKPRPRPGSAA